MKKILVLCTGNSCRSQMAEGFLRSFDNDLCVRSAGIIPSPRVHPRAIRVMQERGIDISNGIPENVDKYLNEEWDWVITVCDSAKETCPLFLGQVKNRLHIGFEDPSNVSGTENEIMTAFREARDKIEKGFRQFYNENIIGKRNDSTQ